MNNTNEDIDLSHALERKGGDDNKSVIKNNYKPEFNSSGFGMANWMVRHSFGVLKNENQANIFLMVISIAAIIFAVIFVVSSMRTSSVEAPQSKEVY